MSDLIILDSKLSFKSLTFNNNPDTIILHHAEASKCTPQDIHAWHLERGWSGAAYHFFVKKDGTIYSMRPMSAQGAHCPGYNIRSVGVCAEGMYEVEGMPTVQKNAIISLCSYIKGKFTIKNIYGHRQVYQTSCPGKNYPLSEIVALVSRGTIVDAVVSIKPDAFVPSTLRTWFQVGDAGTGVTNVQSQLNKVGFKCPVDGSYGKETKNAVFSFQQAIGIQADGLAGQTTKEALEKITNAPTDGVNYPHMEYATRYIQYRIGIPPTGVFGDSTAKIVSSYQTSHKLVADGVVGPKTWEVFFS